MERRKLIRVDVRLSVSSALFQIKGHPEGLYDVVVHTDPQRSSVTICSFGTDVAGGGIASHYCFDHASFSGLVFPTLRRVVSRTSTGPLISGRTRVLLLISDVLVL